MHKSSTKMWRSSLGAWEIGEKVMAVNEMKVVDKRIPGSLRWWPCIPLYCSTFYRLRQPQYNIYLINNTQKPCFFFFEKAQKPCMHASLEILSMMMKTASMGVWPYQLCWECRFFPPNFVDWLRHKHVGAYHDEIPGNITKSMHGRIYIYSLWLIKNEAYVYFCLYIFVTLFLPIY